eukprot:1349313-Amorphochlora_amoeboformis.AAC.3
METRKQSWRKSELSLMRRHPSIILVDAAIRCAISQYQVLSVVDTVELAVYFSPLDPTQVSMYDSA